MAATPKANIEWSKVKANTHKVEIRSTPKGGNSYYVVTDQRGRKFVPFWGGQDAWAAQYHLNTLAHREKQRKAKVEDEQA